MELVPAFRMLNCPSCVEAWEAKEAQRLAQFRPKTRLEKWEGICPPLYFKTDEDRIKREGKLKVRLPKPMGSKEFVEMLLERPWSIRGLGFCGDVRIGKTRLMFSLLKRYYLAGKRVMYVYAPDFSDRYAALMHESPAKGTAYLEYCETAEIWFLDDLGKGRLSESAQRALLRVIEKRTNSERPIFVTCNDDGNTLIQRMRFEDTGLESEYAKAMIERLREFCDFYEFDSSGTKTK